MTKNQRMMVTAQFHLQPLASRVAQPPPSKTRIKKRHRNPSKARILSYLMLIPMDCFPNSRSAPQLRWDNHEQQMQEQKQMPQGLRWYDVSYFFSIMIYMVPIYLYSLYAVYTRNRQSSLCSKTTTKPLGENHCTIGLKSSAPKIPLSHRSKQGS